MTPFEGPPKNYVIRGGDEGIRRLPNDPDLWNDKAVFLEKAQRFDEAREAYSRAIELSEAATGWPEEKKAMYLLNRSDLLRRESRLQEAEVDSRSALTLLSSARAGDWPNH
jgi:tetratricopeptide (TPR) repeat protein